MRNSVPPWDHHRGLGIDLLQGSRGRQFLMSEVPLCGSRYGLLGLGGHPRQHFLIMRACHAGLLEGVHRFGAIKFDGIDF